MTNGPCILTEADILAGRDDDCTTHDHEGDYRTMPWQDLLQEVWDRVYEGYPEGLREEVSRRFAAQDARGKQYMLRDVGSSLWHHFDMTDREDDCGA